MGGRGVTFRTLLIIKNIILYNACSTFLCWQKKNCRVVNNSSSSEPGATPSRQGLPRRQKQRLLQGLLQADVQPLLHLVALVPAAAPHLPRLQPRWKTASQ